MHSSKESLGRRPLYKWFLENMSFSASAQCSLAKPEKPHSLELDRKIRKTAIIVKVRQNRKPKRETAEDNTEKPNKKFAKSAKPKFPNAPFCN